MRVHSDRRNLAIHACAVPLFIVSVVVLLVSAVRGAYVAAIIALGLALVAMTAQGRGHALEAHAPDPFSGPANFLKRRFTEQFLIFPLFLATGRWWCQFKNDNNDFGSAA